MQKALSSDEVTDLQGMFHWPWLKKIALNHRVAQNAVSRELAFALSAAEAIHAASALVAKVEVMQQWEPGAALEKINHLIRVESPRMLTCGVMHQAPAKGNFFENLHRARAVGARYVLPLPQPSPYDKHGAYTSCPSASLVA